MNRLEYIKYLANYRNIYVGAKVIHNGSTIGIVKRINSSSNIEVVFDYNNDEEHFDSYPAVSVNDLSIICYEQ